MRLVYMTKNCVVCIASAYYKTIDTSNLTDYKKCLSENCDHTPLKHFLKLTAHSLVFCEVYCFLFLEKKTAQIKFVHMFHGSRYPCHDIKRHKIRQTKDVKICSLQFHYTTMLCFILSPCQTKPKFFEKKMVTTNFVSNRNFSLFQVNTMSTYNLFALEKENVYLS